MQVRAPVVVQLLDWSSTATTLKPVTAEPPLEAGADHETAADVLEEVAWTASGIPGGSIGITELDAFELAPAPTELAATTVKL